MAKKCLPLTASAIKNAKPKNTDYTLSDGNGLYLIVRSTGTKSFIFKYSHLTTSQRITLSLGAFPYMSLADAREEVAGLKKLLAKNIDPQQNKKSNKRDEQLRLNTTLRTVAARWFSVKKTRVTPDYADDIWRSLERHAFPNLGETPISEINAPETLATLEKLHLRGALETVKRVCQRLNEIMVFATNTGLITHNPIAGINVAFPPPEKKSLPTLKPNELPVFLQALRLANIHTPTRCLIEFQLHTMVRPSEAAGARWSEIDWDKKLWEISAERMKMRRKHVVPLSRSVLALLEYMHRYSGAREHIFPSVKAPTDHLNAQTANMAIKRMGFGGRLVAHGFRSLASTILNEQEFNRDWIEAALAHVDENTIRGAYNRAVYLEQRREMMQWWSEHIKSAELTF